MAGKKKQTNNRNVITRVIAFILVMIVLAGGICALGFSTRNSSGKWFKETDMAKWHWADKVSADKPGNNTPLTPSTVVGDGGAVLTAFAGSGGAMFRSTSISKLNYEDYGIAPQSDGAYSINVITNTIGAIDVFTWESSNPAAVSIASISEDTRTATIVCNAPFGETIIITATSTNNSEINASCLVDYAKRIEAANCSFNVSYAENTWDDEGLPIKVDVGTENFNISSTSTSSVSVIHTSGSTTATVSNFSISTTGGVGTIEDYDGTKAPTIRLSVVSSLKSEIQSKLGVTLEPVTVDINSSFYDTSETIMRLFSGSTQTQAYTLLQSYKENGVAALQYEFSFIGKYTGNTYTVSMPLIFDFSNFFEQSGIKFDKDHIIF